LFNGKNLENNSRKMELIQHLRDASLLYATSMTLGRIVRSSSSSKDSCHAASHPSIAAFIAALPRAPSGPSFSPRREPAANRCGRRSAPSAERDRRPGPEPRRDRHQSLWKKERTAGGSGVATPDTVRGGLRRSNPTAAEDLPRARPRGPTRGAKAVGDARRGAGRSGPSPHEEKPQLLMVSTQARRARGRVAERAARKLWVTHQCAPEGAVEARAERSHSFWCVKAHEVVARNSAREAVVDRTTMASHRQSER
jgi:hypothetical protein